MVAGDRCPRGLGPQELVAVSPVQPERFTISVDSLAMDAVLKSMAVGTQRYFEFPFISAGEGDKLFSQLESFGRSYGPGYTMLSLLRDSNPPGTVSLRMGRTA